MADETGVGAAASNAGSRAYAMWVITGGYPRLDDVVPFEKLDINQQLRWNSIAYAACQDSRDRIAELEAALAATPPDPAGVVGALDVVIAQLRHAYTHLYAERVREQRDFADGLISPQIKALEALRDGAALAATPPDPAGVVGALETCVDALIGARAFLADAPPDVWNGINDAVKDGSNALRSRSGDKTGEVEYDPSAPEEVVPPSPQLLRGAELLRQLRRPALSGPPSSGDKTGEVKTTWGGENSPSDNTLYGALNLLTEHEDRAVTLQDKISAQAGAWAVRQALLAISAPPASAKTIDLPPTTEDQREYLAKLQLATSDYDPNTVIRGHDPEAPPASAQAPDPELERLRSLFIAGTDRGPTTEELHALRDKIAAMRPSASAQAQEVEAEPLASLKEMVADKLADVKQRKADGEYFKPAERRVNTLAAHVKGEETDALIDRFSTFLKAKLRAAEEKYGWNNGWINPGWEADCQRDLLRHVEKGDPLDVAIYAAFCWHHGWPTAALRTRTAATASEVGAVADIAAERRRQVEAEGWTPEHDDTHTKFELASAASCYAVHAQYIDRDKLPSDNAPAWWPWDRKWWKPVDRRRDLVKAGALIVAEIERLDRAAAPVRSASLGGFAGDDEGWNEFAPQPKRAAAIIEEMRQLEVKREALSDELFDIWQKNKPASPLPHDTDKPGGRS